MKTKDFRLELLETFDGGDDELGWHLKMAIMLVQCEDTFDGTTTTYKRIGVLTEEDSCMSIDWDCGKDTSYPGCLYDGILAIQSYIETLTDA